MRYGSVQEAGLAFVIMIKSKDETVLCWKTSSSSLIRYIERPLSYVILLVSENKGGNDLE